MTQPSTQQRPQPVFDKQDQFNKITANLLQGEFVLAVYDCIGAGTGFVGITVEKRVIVQDNSFVGKKTALTSIPYTKVNAGRTSRTSRMTEPRLRCQGSSHSL